MEKFSLIALPDYSHTCVKNCPVALLDFIVTQVSLDLDLDLTIDIHMQKTTLIALLDCIDMS